MLHILAFLLDLVGHHDATHSATNGDSAKFAVGRIMESDIFDLVDTGGTNPLGGIFYARHIEKRDGYHNNVRMPWLILLSLCFSVKSWLKTEDAIYEIMISQSGPHSPGVAWEPPRPALAFGKCGEVNLNVTSVPGPLRGDPRSAFGRVLREVSGFRFSMSSKKSHIIEMAYNGELNRKLGI
jgi:hypothetical protein